MGRCRSTFAIPRPKILRQSLGVLLKVALSRRHFEKCNAHSNAREATRYHRNFYESHVNLLSMDENSYLTSYPADVNNQKKRDDKYLTSYPDRKGRTRGFARRTASGG
jgi:hypothetical protein